MDYKDIENFTDGVMETIEDWFKNRGFKARKVTDTPIDSLQVVNKKYVDDQIASLIAAPSHMLIHSKASVYNTYYRQFAFSPDWSKIVFSAAAAANVLEIFRNQGKDKTAEFLYTSSTSVTPNNKYVCYVPGVDNFLNAADGANNLIYAYPNDNTLSTETLCTISGTASTSIKGITADNDYVYVFDGGTATVRRYTMSGTTLTYVDAITLADSTAKDYLAVDDNYLYTYDTTNNKYWVFNKSSGATITSFTSVPNSGSERRGLCIDPDGDLRQFVSYSTDGASPIVFYLTKISLI